MLVEGAPLRRDKREGRLVGGPRPRVRRVQVVHHARLGPCARKRLRPHLRATGPVIHSQEQARALEMRASYCSQVVFEA